MLINLWQELLWWRLHIGLHTAWMSLDALGHIFNPKKLRELTLNLFVVNSLLLNCVQVHLLITIMFYTTWSVSIPVRIQGNALDWVVFIPPHLMMIFDHSPSLFQVECFVNDYLFFRIRTTAGHHILSHCLLLCVWLVIEVILILLSAIKGRGTYG